MKSKYFYFKKLPLQPNIFIVAVGGGQFSFTGLETFLFPSNYRLFQAIPSKHLPEVVIVPKITIEITLDNSNSSSIGVWQVENLEICRLHGFLLTRVTMRKKKCCRTFCFLSLASTILSFHENMSIELSLWWHCLINRLGCHSAMIESISAKSLY